MSVSLDVVKPDGETPSPVSSMDADELQLVLR